MAHAIIVTGALYVSSILGGEGVLGLWMNNQQFKLAYITLHLK